MPELHRRTVPFLFHSAVSWNRPVFVEVGSDFFNQYCLFSVCVCVCAVFVLIAFENQVIFLLCSVKIIFKYYLDFCIQVKLFCVNKLTKKLFLSKVLFNFPFLSLWRIHPTVCSLLPGDLNVNRQAPNAVIYSWLHSWWWPWQQSLLLSCLPHFSSVPYQICIVDWTSDS